MKLDKSRSNCIKLILTSAISFSVVSGSQLFFNYTRKGEPASIVYDKYYSFSSKRSVIRLNNGENDYYISEEEFNRLLDDDFDISIDGVVFNREEVEKAFAFYNFEQNRNQKLNIWLPLTLGSLGINTSIFLSIHEIKKRNKILKK